MLQTLPLNLINPFLLGTNLLMQTSIQRQLVNIETVMLLLTTTGLTGVLMEPCGDILQQVLHRAG